MGKLKLDIQVLANKYSIKERSINTLVSLSSDKGGVEKAEVIAKTGLTRTQVNRILTELSTYFNPPSQRVVLQDEYRDEALKLEEDGMPSDVFSHISLYHSQRPLPERKYDQFYATTETVAKRSAKLYSEGDIQGRSVAFLGDDDLTSIGVASLKSARKISVFEIDPRIVRVIESARKEDYTYIDIVRLDLRGEIPTKYKNKYDVIFTDPPYTPAGISLFVNRGIELLRKDGTSRLYVCYGTGNSPEKEYKVQQILIEKGLRILSVIPHFNEYRGAESIGNSSSLYVLGVTNFTKLTQIGGKVYTHE